MRRPVRQGLLIEGEQDGAGEEEGVPVLIRVLDHRPVHPDNGPVRQGLLIEGGVVVIILSVTSNWTALTSMETHSTLAPVDANLDAKMTSKSIKDGVYDSRDTPTVLRGSPPKDIAEVDADLRGAVV